MPFSEDEKPKLLAQISEGGDLAKVFQEHCSRVAAFVGVDVYQPKWAKPFHNFKYALGLAVRDELARSLPDMLSRHVETRSRSCIREQVQARVGWAEKCWCLPPDVHLMALARTRVESSIARRAVTPTFDKAEVMKAAQEAQETRKPLREVLCPKMVFDYKVGQHYMDSKILEAVMPYLCELHAKEQEVAALREACRKTASEAALVPHLQAKIRKLEHCVLERSRSSGSDDTEYLMD